MLPASSPLVAALDANVLFGDPLRNTLLLAVEAELYRAAWSHEVWDEVVRNLEDLQRKRPRSREYTQRLMKAVIANFQDAFVDGYQSLIPVMPVDPKDRHVVAMAVRAGAHVLVTYNRRHFPATALAPYGIDVQHPDEFLYNLYGRAPQEMVQLIHTQAGLLTNPPKTPHDILDAFEQAHITRFAQAIRGHLTQE